MTNYNNEIEISGKRLEIIENYKELIKCDYDENLIPVIIELKKECKLINEVEYYYWFDVVLTDIYINSSKLDDALSIVLKDYNDLPCDKYYDLHISVLERIIYIYITKQYYQTALKYATEKRKYFNNPNTEIINRWYLEMAYIHEALGEKSRSLTELNAILENNPSDALKLNVLSNITKLYIDDANINEALSNLTQCFALCYKLNDKKSEKYCEFLRAKIFRLQKDYNKSLIIFNKLINDLNILEDDNFNYLNEYLILLQEMKSLNEAKKICEKYIFSVDESNDLFNKKLFYENYLRIRTNLITKSKNSLDHIFNKLNEVENQIISNKDSKIDEFDDLSNDLNIDNDSKVIFDEMIDLSNQLDKIEYSSLREYIMESSKVIENYCKVNEILLVIYSENNVNIIPTFSGATDKIKSYDYKVNRLYERTLNFDDLVNTPLEYLVNGSNEVMFNLSTELADVLDPISKNLYSDLQVKYIYGKPLKEKKDIFGSIIYLSRNADITSIKYKVYLDFITKIIESNLLNIFKNANIDTQKGLINTAMNGLDINIFYQNINDKRLFIPQSLLPVLENNNSEMTFMEYENLVDVSDKLKYQNKYLAIKEKKEYKINYHLNIEGHILSILEQASPYLDNPNYYFGTICNIDVTKSITDFVEASNVSTKEEFLNDIEFLNKNHPDENCDFICLKVFYNDYINDLNIENINIIKDICDAIKSVFNSKVYLINDVFVIKSNYKTLSKLIKDVIKKINNIYYFKENAITPIIKNIVISYPKDINNLSDLEDFINYLFNLTTLDINRKYDGEYFNKYLNYKALNKCVINGIVDDSIELLYSKLLVNNSLDGYLVIPNIKGLTESASLLLLDPKVKVKLEVKLFEEILKSSLKNIYLNVSIQSLNKILNTHKDILVSETAKNISLIVDEVNDIDNNINNELLNKIAKTGLNIYISGNNIKEINIKHLNDGIIKGVYNIKEEDIYFIKLFNYKLNFITGNKDFIDAEKVFNKVSYMTDEIIIF